MDKIINISTSDAFATVFNGLSERVAVFSAATAAEALRLIADHHIDIAFVSAMDPVPDLSLHSLLTTLKSHRPSLQMIVCFKGYDADSKDIPDVVSYIKTGVFDVLEWPSSPYELMWLIGRAATAAQLIPVAMTPTVDLNGALHRLISHRHTEGMIVTESEIRQVLESPEAALDTVVADLMADSVSARQATRTIRVLSIEDEPTLREMIYDFIRATFSGAAASDARSGMDLIGRDPFDVVLLDIGLPDMFGNEAIAPIKEHNPDADIVILTAYHSYELIKATIANGAVDYMVKPFEFEELRAVILRQAQQKILARCAQ